MMKKNQIGKFWYAKKLKEWAKIIIVSFINHNPKNKIHNQKNALAMVCIVQRFIISDKNHAHPIIKNESVVMLNFNPMFPKITSGKTPPIFVQITRPTAFEKLKTQAPTKAIIIKETKVLLCKIDVANIQVKIALNLVLVNFLKRDLNVLLVKFFILSSKIWSPKSKSQNPQIKFAICDNEIMVILWNKI